jgi:ferredoxin
MSMDLYVYSGTGNSLWTARTMAAELDGAGTRIVSLSHLPAGATASRADAVGIIFPVHIWGVPRRVIAFVKAIEVDPAAYCFAVAVNAGQVAATLVQLQGLLRVKGLFLACGFGLAMPSNYIPWGGPGPQKKQQATITAAQRKIGRITAAVANRETRPVERGPLWQSLLFTGLNRLAFPRVPMMDRSFKADEKCNGCGVCRAVCPCGNISLAPDGRPVWHHGCEQCLACIQWCPQEAIQYGEKTSGYQRYHHPEIRLADMTALPVTGGQGNQGGGGKIGKSMPTASSSGTCEGVLRC